MADKKMEKALYGPSLTEVALGAVLGLLAGIVLAGIYLVFKPVPTVKETPKEPGRGAVYYLAGSESKAKSRAWEAKLKQFLAGETVQLNEDELNAWIATQKTAASSKPTAPGAPPAPVEGYVIPGQPNCRIVADKLQVGLSCTLNWYGLATEVIVQATGSFRKVGGQYVFTPERVYLGSCPLHLLPGTAGLLTSHIIEKQKFPDEVRAAWAKLGEVTVADGTVSLTAP